MKKDSDRSKEQLIQELTLLRQRISDLEVLETERKKAEEQFQKGRDSAQKYLDIVGVIVIAIDAKQKVTLINRKGCELLGYQESEIIGKNWFDNFLPERVRDEVKTVFDRMAAGEIGLLKYHQSPVLTSSGEERLIAWNNAALYDEKGTIISTLSSGEDITERERWEMELKLRAQILDSAIDSIFLHDSDGNFEYVNETACRSRGYTREELMEMNLFGQLDTPEYARNKEQNLRMLTEKGTAIFEAAHSCKDGAVIPVEVHASIVESGNKRFILGIARDISRRRKAEEALQESEAKYKTLTESSLTGIFITQDEKQVYSNDRFAQMHGYKSGEEIVGMNYLATVHPDDRKFVKRIATNRLKGHPAPRHYEIRRLTKDGETFWAEIIVTTIEYKGKPAIMGNIVDITERKQMEAERLEMELMAQSTSRLASVGKMAAGIAHEINNPLTGVIGYAELLQQHEDVPEHIKKDLKIIHQGAQRVANIAKRLLAFARQSKPMRDYVNIHELIQNTLELRAYQLRTSNIEVTTKLDPNMPITVADGGQLQQVFLNIIANAETEMKLAHGKGKLLIKTKKLNNNIRISFKDDGPGIARENMDRIFDPFFTTREVGQGTGLGLSMCHGIVAEHDGRIWTESKLGQGATFFVDLPIVAEKEKTEEAKPVVEETEKVAKVKVLVVDDENIVRQLLSRVLTDEGHQVETVDNAEDALKKIKNERYHLILLDIKMPGMSGMELYQRIQKIAKSIADRVVFVTGDVGGADTKKFLEETKAPYITKPFDARLLKKELKRLLSR